ncbi:MAG: bile acid:sodium symporter [Pseudomonadota bacterium]
MDAQTLDQLRIALDPASQVGLALALFMIMFSVALGLEVRDFKALLDRPRVYASGVVGQVIGLPLLTLALVFLISPPASIALGMIVVAACPGGNVSNMMTYFSRGDTALSVALTATSSVIAAFFTPAAILLWASLYPPTASLLQSIEFNAIAFVLQTTALLAVPLGLGMSTARWAPNLAARIRKPGAAIGAFILAVIVIVGTFDKTPKLLAATGLILPPVIIHSSAAFALGAVIGALLKVGGPTRRALTFEIGLQNTGLALVILLGQLEGLGGAAALTAVWGVWHLIAGGFMVWLYRRRS